MFALLMVIHVVVALFLIGVILLQGGRGGLGEALGGAAAQSLFGGGANTVIAKITTVAAGLFMVTCLSLAILSTARGRSVIEQLPASLDQLPLTLPQDETGGPASAPSQPPAAASGPASPTPAASPAPNAAPSQPAPPASGGSTAAP